MNKVDLVILCIIGLFMIFGYHKGLIKSIFSVAQYFIVISVSIALAPVVSKILIERFNLDIVIINWINNNITLFSDTISIINEEILRNITGRIINVFSIVILFIMLKIICTFAVVILNKIANLPILSLVNRLGGLIIGAINGVLVVYLLILLINWLPLESLNLLRKGVESSFLGVTISSYLPEVTTEVITMVKTSV